jgi:hypothetical protein
MLPYPDVRHGLTAPGTAPTTSAFPTTSAVPTTSASPEDALPATRWLLLGPPGAAEPLVRALAADVLAGATTTLTVVAAEGVEALVALARRLGVERRLVRVAPRDALALFTGTPAVDLVVGPDPLAAADPLLTTAFAAGVPAVLARAPGSEDLVDEVAGTGAVRIVRPAADVVTLLEAVADLREALIRVPRPDGVLAPGPLSLSTLLGPWRTSPDEAARQFARVYGELVASGPATQRPRPRVLVVDLAGGHRKEVGKVARWVVGVGGEPVVVTAAVPPPSAGVTGAVSVDLRALERRLARGVARVRRRLPGRARPVLDRARRMLRPESRLVKAALRGPLAGDTAPSPDFDVVVAADSGGAELARRWTGMAVVLQPDIDQLIAHLTATAGAVATLAQPATASSAGSEGS